MTRFNQKLKDDMIRELLLGAGEKIPTSTLGRLGRTGATVLRSARMIASARKKRDLEQDAGLDMEKVAKIVTSVGRLKGIAMKMGQIMSYIDLAIPEELREAFSVLQTHAQPMPWEKVEQIVQKELGDGAVHLLAEMEKEPIAAASIGQVHRSRLPGGQGVAVKVQYPEVAEAIETDFGPAAVGTRLASLIYPHARFDDFVKEARGRFLEECDYLHEAHSHGRFAKLYRQHPVLFVPEVIEEYCSKRVLTTQYVSGLKLEPFLAGNPGQEERNRLGEALFEFYIGSLFRYQIYNCDPHPGNYLFLGDGRVAMLDHGCTRQFAPSFVALLAKLTRAVAQDDRNLLHQRLVDLNIVREGKKYNFDLIRGFLRSFYGPMLDDLVMRVDLSSAMEMGEVIKKKQQLAQFALPGEFLFLFRIRFGLMSVIASLGAESNWFRLEKKYVDEFAAAHPFLMR